MGIWRQLEGLGSGEADWDLEWFFGNQMPMGLLCAFCIPQKALKCARGTGSGGICSRMLQILCAPVGLGVVETGRDDIDFVEWKHNGYEDLPQS